MTDHDIGLDTTPLIIPIREFHRENYRTLSNLPQQPMLRSAPKRRLVLSWWERELSIWRILPSRSDDQESDLEEEKPTGRRLMAKIALQVSSLYDASS